MTIATEDDLLEEARSIMNIHKRFGVPLCDVIDMTVSPERRTKVMDLCEQKILEEKEKSHEEV